MAERKVPVESAPVEPRTARGRRKMDEVAAEAARAAAKTASRSTAAKTAAKTKTALLAEQERQAEIIRRKRDKELKERKLRRSEQWGTLKLRAATLARVAMVVVPIIAPMSVAWTGQSGFATSVLGWNFLASLLYAAAYELTTVFSAYMYHEAKRDGDKGWEYRLATWVFAAGAGMQQWWHYSDNWHATPRSVTYSTMTAVGVVVWELYARLIHRRGLRADGKLAAPRPRIGLARWLRYPRISWTAWSGSVRYGFESFQDVWTWAEAQREIAAAEKRKNTDLKKQLKAANARIADLESPKSDRVVKGELERVSTPDPEQTSTPQPELEAGPVPTPRAAGELEAGSPSGETYAGSSDDFTPTPSEIQAVKLMIESGQRLNRENVADFIRENREALGQPEGIATKRAALVAKWGRENTDGLKAVS